MIPRHRTAIGRTALSRPFQNALNDGVLTPHLSVFDYGCGRGFDVNRLQSQGFSCHGWDPIYAPNSPITSADLVNLGYVVNVIENPEERRTVLKDAWSRAHKVLIVSARLTGETNCDRTSSYEDGFLTKTGTFQKFFEQNELRLWIDSTLNESSAAAAPGIFYVFRDAELKYAFLSSRSRRIVAQPQQRRSDQLYEIHRPLFDHLAAFISERGRLPVQHELPLASELCQVAGSFRRAFAIIRRVSDGAQWQRISDARAQDLLVYMALARFEKRPRFSLLPESLQLDIRAFFSNYTRACALADKLLFSAGNRETIEEACRSSDLGKLTPTALYVHSDALGHLSPVLRVYEGCARTLVGNVETANIIKLHIQEPKISYLAYPEFEDQAHPALRFSLLAHLGTFQLDRRDYSESANPPILHRKEEFVSRDHPMRPRFARLTKQEVAHGLFEHPTDIGTRRAWEAILHEKGLRIKGHRLLKISNLH
jgi:DNA phosphorothioation-associated putative methyltransferase